MNGRINDIFHDGIVGKQVEVLEYQSKIPLNLPELLFPKILRMAVYGFCRLLS